MWHSQVSTIFTVLVNMRLEAAVVTVAALYVMVVTATAVMVVVGAVAVDVAVEETVFVTVLEDTSVTGVAGY